MKEYLFIVNPIAGNGKSMKCWGKIKKRIDKENLPYQVYYTREKGDGEAWLSSFLRDRGDRIEAVVAIGGDGTANEVINGMMKVRSNLPFGLIPSGSGNDLARSLRIKGWKKALRVILYGEKVLLDVGRINGLTYFINGIGAGFDGEVAFFAGHSSLKKILNRLALGKFIYLISLIRVLFHYQRQSLTLVTEAKKLVFQNAWMVAVGNNPTYGGGMKICPGAKADDGRFQICVVRDMPRWKFLFLFPKVYFGKHVEHPSVSLIEANRVEIVTEKPARVHMDGEIGYSTPVTIEIHPASLNVLHSSPALLHFWGRKRNIPLDKGIVETR